jgi:uncharacterized membrane protein YcaP (DUF421 family)
MNELLASPGQIAVIALRTVVVYAFILVGFRVAGKREVGQLAPFDFALILLIANAVQNAMVGPDSSLVGGLAAATVLLLINAGLGRLASSNRKIERILRGHAQLLIYRGKLHEGHMKSEGLSHAEVLQALRENGCATIEECRLAVLEVDGTISVITQKG